MQDEDQQILTPRLRFPEFRDKPGWELKPLGSLGSFFRGLTYGAHDVADDGLLVLRSSNIQGGRLILDSNLVFVAKECPPALLLRHNDIAICMSNGSKALVGKSGEYAGSYKGPLTVGAFCSIFRPTTPFAKIAFTTQQYDAFVETGIAGGNINNLKNSDLEGFEFTIPRSTAEQRKIAECLGSLDELIAAAGQKLEALRAHKKGLMQHLFPREGETRPRLRFPEFRNTGEWEEIKLDDLAKRRTGHTPNKTKPEYYNGGIKWVSLADSKRLDNGLIHETAIEISAEGIENSSAVLHPAGTVILSRDAGVGKSAVTAVPMAVSQHFIAWICDPGKLSNWFLYFVMQKLKPLFEQIATGSTIKTIGMPFFNAMQIVVPSLSEQQRIAGCLSALDAVLAGQTQKLAALRAHKQALMQQLFPSPDGD